MCFVHFARQVEMALVTKPDIVQPARGCPNSLKKVFAHLLTSDTVAIGQLMPHRDCVWKKTKVFSRILQAGVKLTGTADAKRRRLIDISPSSSTDAARTATLSFDRAFLALPDLPKFCFFNNPVFRNLSVQSEMRCLLGL